jgi:hypothetical protein
MSRAALGKGRSSFLLHPCNAFAVADLAQLGATSVKKLRPRPASQRISFFFGQKKQRKGVFIK